MQIFDSVERLFKGWASVEVIDKQGDLIPLEELKPALEVFMSETPVLTDTHSNKIVGKVLSCEIQELDGKKGVYITGQINKGFKTYDEIWEKIQSGIYRGLSLGGKALSKEKGDNSHILRDIEAFEISVCERPANPLALINAVSVAKSETLNLSFAGFKDFEACVSHMKEKQNYSEEVANKVCGKLQAEYEKILKNANEVDKMEDKKEEAKPEEAKQENPTPTATLDERVAKLEDAIKAIMDKLAGTEYKQPETPVKEDALKNLEAKLDEIKKALTVVETVQTPKPVMKAETFSALDVALGKIKI